MHKWTTADRRWGNHNSMDMNLSKLWQLVMDREAWRAAVRFGSVQFSHSVMFDSLWPHGLQHTRFPCPSLTTAACSNSHPLSQWYHLIISSSAVPLPSRLQSFPASGSLQWVSSSRHMTKVLEFLLQHQSFNEYSGLFSFRMDWLDLLAVQGTLKRLLQHHFTTQLSSESKPHIHTWPLEKP